MPPFNKPNNALRKTLLPLLLPAALLTACASNSPAPTHVSPVLPPPPLLSTPLPLAPYSMTAEQRMQAWQKSLMDTQMMRD